jgi:hypothetical protein
MEAGDFALDAGGPAKYPPEQQKKQQKYYCSGQQLMVQGRYEVQYLLLVHLRLLAKGFTEIGISPVLDSLQLTL